MGTKADVRDELIADVRDELIVDVQARKARAIELERRADCKRRELSARSFLAELKSRE
jgi:hypothetical protein